MQCSCTTIFVTALAMIGTLMCTICGYLALSGTLTLFKEYGPVQGSGNPALDPPPEYWVNPNTGKWEPMYYNNRGNLVPTVFQGIQYYLIAMSIFMFINCVVFFVSSARSKKVVNNRRYQGQKNSPSCLGFTAWLAGYYVFLAIWWLVMVGFSVVPIVEYVITMQRCWDLASPKWSAGTYQKICIDLVQYGLIYFKEVSDSGYALICGPGGNYDPPHGDLQGFCDNYYPNFTLYLVCLVGACITLISMVLFAMRHVSNFVYMKVRRYENPIYPGVQHLSYAEAPYGNSVHNPNYEHNVLLLDHQQLPSNVEMESYRGLPPGKDLELNYIDGDQSRTARRYSSTVMREDRVPSYFGNRLPYGDSKRRTRHSSSDSSRRRDSYSDAEKRPRSRGGASNRRRTSDDDSDLDRKRHRADSIESSEKTHSTVPYRPRPLRRKARSTRSDPDLRKSERRNTRRKQVPRDEYDSPPSDYYIREDLQRQNSRPKSRSRSVY